MRQTATDILERLGSVPDVISAAAVSARPLSRGSTGLGIAAADQPDLPDAQVPWATWRIVTKDYFKTIGRAACWRGAPSPTRIKSASRGAR